MSLGDELSIRFLGNRIVFTGSESHRAARSSANSGGECSTMFRINDHRQACARGAPSNAIAQSPHGRSPLVQQFAGLSHMSRIGSALSHARKEEGR
jgi:hypothetical protein